MQPPHSKVRKILDTTASVNSRIIILFVNRGLTGKVNNTFCMFHHAGNEVFIIQQLDNALRIIYQYQHYRKLDLVIREA